MRPPVLFLDDSGVLNDNAPRQKQWEALVADFFVPRLGGTHALWEEANHLVNGWLSQPDVWNDLVAAGPDYRAFERAFYVAVIGSECRQVGVAVPSDDECVRLGREVEVFVTRRIHSALPGAVETVRRLHAMGYTLHTASGHNSVCLDGYLEAMGVRDCFGRLYGPDLVNERKASRAYYERAFENAGVSPKDALVVDDSVRAVGWAVEAGARAVLVGNRDGVATADERRIERIESIADLPRLLGAVGRS